MSFFPRLEILQPIDAGQPGAVFKEMRIDVVHAGGVPAAAGGRQHGRFRSFAFCIYRGGQPGNFESADLPAIDRKTFLGKTEQPAVIREHSASGARDARVAGYERACGVLRPDGSCAGGRETGSGIQSQRVMLPRVGAGEEPPMVAEAEDGWVRVRAGDEIADVLPLFRAGSGAVQPDGA